MDRIILAFSSDKTAEKIRLMLEGTGYITEHNICHSGAELLRMVQEYDEALVVMGFKLPDMTVNHIFEQIDYGIKLMSITKAEHIDDIEYDDIFSLPLPVNRQRLVSAINVLFGQIPTRKRTQSVVRSPEENKIIEQAKLFLMDTYNMTEQQAHRFIQKRSMDIGAKFIDTARTILNIDE